jgi:bacteriocin biosynthesis cyclodehydratase domain-containing protein
VVVDGEGIVADAAAAAMTAAGVGVVSRQAPPGSGHPGQAGPDLHVIVRTAAVDVCEADALVAGDLAHLAVVVAGDRLVVGPLVLPGRSPCLRCLDLHRTDRDPAWPKVAAQLTRPAAVRTPVETASATMAAGLVALQALAHLDGQVVPASVGRTLEVVLPDGLLERRRWSAHPSCGCRRLPIAAGAACGAQRGTTASRLHVQDNGDRD